MWSRFSGPPNLGILRGLVHVPPIPSQNLGLFRTAEPRPQHASYYPSTFDIRTRPLNQDFLRQISFNYLYQKCVSTCLPPTRAKQFEFVSDGDHSHKISILKSMFKKYLICCFVRRNSLSAFHWPPLYSPPRIRVDSSGHGSAFKFQPLAKVW